MNKFAERFRDGLKDLGLTQAEMGAKLNLTHRTISDYCAGKTEPRIDTLIEISKILGETIDYLVGKDEV